jgi:23S rRNA-/tRNA-specific pseudouridylate synthase
MASLLMFKLTSFPLLASRIHLQSIGHPIVGDSAYGAVVTTTSNADAAVISEHGTAEPPLLTPTAKRTTGAGFTTKKKNVLTLHLHSWKARFVHPGTGEPTWFASPLPSWANQLYTGV